MGERAQKSRAVCRVFAKVNLSLNISDVRGGYHLIDSVAASVSLFDEVKAVPRRDGLINVYMHGMGSEQIPPERNNAVRAGELFVSARGTCGADIEIRKNIPQGAGLGGSSADAAGVLNALAELYGAEREEIAPLAEACGSDTRYMLTGGFARLFGRGERVQPLLSPKTYHMLLLVPQGGTSAAACYRQYDVAPDPLRADSARLAAALVRGDFAGVCGNVYNALGRAACALSEGTAAACYRQYDVAPDPLRADSARLAAALVRGDFAGVCGNVYNALGRAACALSEGTAAALELARSLSPAACAVTGSGSAVFALFETRELCLWAQGHCRGKKGLRALPVSTVAQGCRM